MRLAPLDEAETPSPRRRGKKRRLVFADDVMKLSKDDMRHNMSSAHDLTLPEEEVNRSQGLVRKGTFIVFLLVIFPQLESGLCL